MQTNETIQAGERNATESFKSAQVSARNHIAKIQSGMIALARSQNHDEFDWGFVGDMGRVNALLEEINAILH